MKKLLLLITASLLSGGTWAECDSKTNATVLQECMSSEVKNLKKELNSTYNKVYSATEAKKELDKAQKAWLAYREIQCGEFTIADAGYGAGQISYSLDCSIQLTKSRISYLKSIDSTQ